MRTSLEIARHGGTFALNAGTAAWERARDRRRADVMHAWADKHGYSYAPTVAVPAARQVGGHGLHRVIGSVHGHHTTLLDAKASVPGARQQTRLRSVLVIAIDGVWPAHPDDITDADYPFQWRIHGKHLTALWPTVVTPDSMWTAANTLTAALGLSRSHHPVPRLTPQPSLILDELPGAA